MKGTAASGTGDERLAAGKPTELSVIVISWNTAGYLARCLDSLVKSELQDLPAEVWVVDNASGDGSQQMVQSRYPWVRLQANTTNLGFAAANNAVMRQAEGSFFLLLNADMEVPPGTISGMLSRMRERHDVGIAACRQVDCLGKDLESYMFNYAEGLLPDPAPLALERDGDGREVQVAWVWGSGMAVRREVFEQLGGFDEAFFMYYEDLEWCWRIRKAGWKVVCYPDLWVRHFVRRSTAKVPPEVTTDRLAQGELVLRKRHMSPLRYRRFLTARFLYALRGVIFYRLMLAIAPCERFRTKYFRYLANVRQIYKLSCVARAVRKCISRLTASSGEPRSDTWQ